MLTSGEAIALIGTLEEIVRASPAAPAEFREAAKRILFQLQAAPGPRQIVHEKVASLRGWVNILSGDNRTDSYEPGQVQSFIIADCAVLRGIVARAGTTSD